jgi:tetratricopeptide (TPR) repeat protein
MKKSIFALAFVLCIVLLLSCKTADQKEEMAITTTSDEASQLFIQGRDKWENIEIVAAAELLDQAIEKDPDFALAYLYRAFTGRGYPLYRENLNKAVSLIDKISEGEKHFILFNQAGADGDGVKEKAELDKLLQLLPNDKRVQYYAGAYYYATIDDYAQAMNHFNNVKVLDANYAPVYNLIGYCQSQLENYDQAEEAFKMYIKLIPDSPNSYDSYAELLLKLGKFDASIEQYQKAYETDARYTVALGGIGDNFIFKKDFEKAREYYQQQFDNAQNLGGKLSALFWKITSFVHEGNIEEAIKTCEQRSSFSKENNHPTGMISSYNFAGYILTESEEFEKASEYFDNARKIIETASLSAEDKASYTLTADMNKCYLFTARGELDAATAEAERCKQIVDKRQNMEEMQTLHLYTGQLEMKKDNIDVALEHFTKADMESPYTWYYLALAQEKKGNNEQASKLFNKVAGWNENGLGLALVVKRAKEKL